MQKCTSKLIPLLLKTDTVDRLRATKDEQTWIVGIEQRGRVLGQMHSLPRAKVVEVLQSLRFQFLAVFFHTTGNSQACTEC